MSLLLPSFLLAKEKVFVKDYSWFRKIKYKDAIIFVLKDGKKSRLVFFKSSKKIFYKTNSSSHDSYGFDYEETRDGYEHRVFTKKNGGNLNIGYLKKPLGVYFKADEPVCRSSKIPFLLKYQIRDFAGIERASNAFSTLWDRSNCGNVLSLKYSDMVLEKLQSGFVKSQSLIESCFSKSDVKARFLQDEASLDFAFNFISGFEQTIENFSANSSDLLELNCDPNPPKNSEKAFIDKTLKPKRLTLNVYDILNPSSANFNLTDIANDLGWSAFHELGHVGYSMPTMTSSVRNCFDEGFVSSLTDVCAGGASGLNMMKVVNGCVPKTKSISEDYIIAQGDRRLQDPGSAATPSQTTAVLIYSQQTAQAIAQNSSATMFAPAPATALDTLANETLATTSGALVSNRERPVITTPAYDAALEDTYRYFSGLTNRTSALMAQALVPQAQAAGASGTATTGYVAPSLAGNTPKALPANVQVYAPAQYIADMTCPTDNCSPSPALVAAYNVKAASASGASPATTTKGVDGSASAMALSSGSGAQGKMTDIAPNSMTQGKLGAATVAVEADPSAADKTPTSGPGSTGSGTGTLSNPVAKRTVANVGASRTVQNFGTSPRNDVEALQALASTSSKVDAQLTPRIRKLYADPEFNQQLALRGWSIQVYNGKTLKKQIGATSGVQQQFIDNGKELVRKKTGK